MPLINLGRTTVNNAVGNVTPNFLLSGLLEINQGAGDITIQSAQNVGDTGIFVIKIHQAVANGETRVVNWANTYHSIAPGFYGLFAGGNPSDTEVWNGMFIQDNGEFYMIWRFFTGV